MSAKTKRQGAIKHALEKLLGEHECVASIVIADETEDEEQIKATALHHECISIRVKKKTPIGEIAELLRCTFELWQCPGGKHMPAERRSAHDTDQGLWCCSFCGRPFPTDCMLGGVNKQLIMPAHVAKRSVLVSQALDRLVKDEIAEKGGVSVGPTRADDHMWRFVFIAEAGNDKSKRIEIQKAFHPETPPHRVTEMLIRALRIQLDVDKMKSDHLLIEADAVHTHCAAFLYILMRDHMPIGKVEEIVRVVQKMRKDNRTAQFTGVHLEGEARDMARRILGEPLQFSGAIKGGYTVHGDYISPEAMREAIDGYKKGGVS